MKTPPRTVFLLAFAGSLLGFAIYKATSARPLDWHARRLADCIGRKDAACVMGYIPTEEVTQLNLKRESVSWLLSHYNFESSSPISLTPEDIEGWKLVTAGYRTQGGGTRLVSFTVSDTAEGIKSPMLTSMILLGQMRSEGSSGISKIQERVDYVQKHRAELERRGFRGYIPDFGKAAITWDEFIADNEARIARIEAAKKGR